LKNTKELKKLLLDKINPIEVFSKELSVKKSDLEITEEHVAFCPFHNDEEGGTPSFGFNIITGKHNCFSCGAKGNNIFSFYEKFYNIGFKKALKKMYSDYIRPIIPYSTVREFNTTLLDSPKALEYLTSTRLLSLEVVESRMLGYDGSRIMIPMFNKFGFCINIRKYDPDSSIKMLPFEKGYGTNLLYPNDNIYTSETIVFCEGEFDALVLESNGFKSITRTAGSKSWNKDFSNDFAGKNIIICLDNDEAGKAGAVIVANELKDICKSIKIASIPIKKKGADVTDFFTRYTKKDFIEKVISAAEIFSKSAIKNSGFKKEEFNVSLLTASESKYYYKSIKLKARVSGKEVLPYYLPKKVNITCRNYEEEHINCFCEPGKKDKSFNIDMWNKDVLKMISCTDSQKDKAILESLEIPKSCKASVEILEQGNAEQVRLTPDVDFSDAGKFVARRAFYLGHDIETNKSYNFKGYSVPDPNTQQIVHILVDKEETVDSLELFKINKV